MSKSFSESSAKDSERFGEKNTQAKAFAQGLQYFNASRYLSCSALALAGPDYFRPVSNALTFIARTDSSHLLLVDNDPKLKEILQEKRRQHALVSPEEAARVRIQIDDVCNVEPYRFEDLDFLNSLNRPMGKEPDRKSASDIIYERLKGQAERFPAQVWKRSGRIRRKAISFTVCRRRVSNGMNVVVDGINRFLGVLDAGIEGIDVPEYNLGSHWGWDKTSPATKDCIVYNQRPIFSSRDQGRLLKLSIMTYKDGSPMVTVLIIYQ